MQERRASAALIRLLFVGFVAIGFWALARYGSFRPPVLAADAPATRFSAGRAEEVLARILGPERPHPAFTDENVAVRTRILHEYAALGIPAKTYTALGCRLNKNFGALACATVTDVLAQLRPGNGKAIVMLSHFDSVPAGPGASDDESGTASIIESARALKTIPDPGVHPILALNTDGEEFGLLGAAAFLDNHQMRSVVGSVVNVEARGDQGPSLLFQTSPGDGPMINLYANSVRAYATSSLFSVIYKYLPNDTDLTLFIKDGFPSWNFAFSDRVAHYHTVLDRRENLDPQTLQMQGENLLGVTNSLAHTDFATLKGHDDIYVSVLGRWLPRLASSWALPLSLLCALAVLVSVSASFRRETTSWRGQLLGLAIVPLTVAAAVCVGWLLHTLATLISGQPNPSYAHPSALRLALALGVFGATILTSRIATMRTAMLAAWIWMAFLALASSLFVVGLSPYFLFPTLVSLPLVLAFGSWREDWGQGMAQVVVFLASVPSLLVWLPLVASGETVSGLALHPLFTVPAAIGLASISPLLMTDALPQAQWRALSGAVFAASIVLAVVAGLQPAFSAAMPQRLNIQYVEDATTHRAFWAADAGAPLPSSLRRVGGFSSAPERPYSFANLAAYVAPAGTPRYVAPAADVSTSFHSKSTRFVTLALHGSTSANQIILAVPKSARIKGITIEGEHFDVPSTWMNSPLPYNLIACFSRDCANKTIVLQLAAMSRLDLFLGEIRYGVPREGARLIAARPPTAVESQNGDTTILINSVTVPGA